MRKYGGDEQITNSEAKITISINNNNNNKSEFSWIHKKNSWNQIRLLKRSIILISIYYWKFKTKKKNLKETNFYKNKINNNSKKDVLLKFFFCFLFQELFKQYKKKGKDGERK